MGAYGGPGHLKTHLTPSILSIGSLLSPWWSSSQGNKKYKKWPIVTCFESLKGDLGSPSVSENILSLYLLKNPRQLIEAPNTYECIPELLICPLDSPYVQGNENYNKWAIETYFEGLKRLSGVINRQNIAPIEPEAPDRH